MIDYSAIEAVVRRAGQMIVKAHPEKGSIKEKKGPTDFVTDYDFQIQSFLIGSLGKLVPEATFFCEEDTPGNQREEAAGTVFYIDPIDGTTNFIFGYHHSCVSVGLAIDGRMIAGFVYNPYVDDFYKAVRGQGAYRNGQRLFMENAPLERGIVAFGTARNERRTEAFFTAIRKLYEKSISIRNGGSAALDLCRIADSSNVAYLQLQLNPFDYAAAQVIIEEAGGVITRLDGRPVSLCESCSVVAGTIYAQQEVRAVLEECFRE